MPRKSMKKICLLLDPNSSYIPNNDKVRANAVKEGFVNRGWRRSFIEEKLAKLDDTMLEGWKTAEFMEDYVKEAIHRPTTYPSIKQSMLEFGVCEQKAQEAHDVMEPLHNTCYTDSQMVDVALEYLVGRYDPLCP
jgi:hypothetical protein